MKTRQLKKLWRGLMQDGDVPRHFPKVCRLGIRGVYRRAMATSMISSALDAKIFNGMLKVLVQEARWAKRR
jgi:hypothetical protein